MTTAPPRRVRLAVALAVTAVLAVAGCGGSDDDATDTTTTTTEDATTSTTEAGTTTTDEEPPTTEEEPEDGDDPDSEPGDDDAPAGDLQGVLLTVDDLPDGFVTFDDVGSSDLSEDEPLCEGGEPAVFDEPVEEASRDFSSDDDEALLASFALRFEDDGAAAVLDFFRDEVERCGGVGSDGEAYELSELTGLGDEALSIDIDLEFEGESLTAGLRTARVGDVVVAVTLFGELDVLDLEGLLGVMVDRL